MLVVTDEETAGVCGQSGLAGTRETEEKSDVAAVHADVGRRVQGELSELDGL